MKDQKYKIAFIGAGTIGTALGNILAESGAESILLHSIEKQTVDDINRIHVNSKYFPTLHLHPNLYATTDDRLLENSEVIFLAIPSVVLIDYLNNRTSKMYLEKPIICVN